MPKYHQDKRNANKGTDRGRAALKQSLERLGAGRSVLVDKHNVIIAGNKTMEAAEAIGMSDNTIVVETTGDKLVVVKRMDLDLEAKDVKAIEMSLADNRVAQLGLDFDLEILKTDLEMLQSDFLDELWTPDDLGELFKPESPVVIEDEPPIDKASELQAKWQVSPGDLWIIGEHRLICGDCTDKATVDRLMGGEKADLVFTDPPYGVSYADKNKFLNEIDKGNRIQSEIKNDHMSIDDIKPIWLGAFTYAHDNATDKASFYSFMPQGGDQMMMMMMMMISEAGWMPKHELIWLKNNHVLGRADYAYKHEPILYGWKRNGTHKYYGGFQTSIFEFDKPLKSEFHPTMKPIALVAKLIENSTVANMIVLDPFLGSGTTMVAAHQTGRRCYGLEIAPGYCAVILERLSKLGLTTVKQ